ncbi:phosphatidylinositol transfer protein beta isoform isoform X2 [Rattus norvegicus]|uniref:phosphatidylinositol transfer protein beta isoform isoform X2 n=1 Tax=Rattus norvegicus TaxID=10116 RepID=UPI002FD7D362
MALSLERDPHWGAVLRRFLQNCEGWVTFLCFLQNEYMKDDFFIKIETWHKPDLGTLENVHGLDPNTWKTVEIVHIDIADRSQVEPADYKADEDPALFQSVKTKRGPLGPNWKCDLGWKLNTTNSAAKTEHSDCLPLKAKIPGSVNRMEDCSAAEERQLCCRGASALRIPQDSLCGSHRILQ